MMLLIGFFLSLLGSGCTVHDLGFSGMVFFGHALQKMEVLDSSWAADGVQQHWRSMCLSSHLTFPDPVIPIALLILFALPFCIFLIGPVKLFLSLVMHAEAPESQIALHVLD